MHAAGEEFLLRATLSAERLLEERERFLATMQEMGTLLEAGAGAPPPGRGLARRPLRTVVPVSALLAPGQAHVRKYVGEETLRERLIVR